MATTVQANEDAQDASGKALDGLVVALAAAAGGGAVGAKLWPRDNRSIDLRDPAAAGGRR